MPGRIGRRIIRRPSRWLNSPWPTERIVQYLTALILVGGATFAVLQVVHLDLVFTNNTPTGGDMGAHVMAPAFLRDELLPNGQLTGWSMYWYAGFPMYRFYMVVPALMIVGLNALWIPYGVAFKIVAVLGLVTLPFCCWAFGRLARFRYPIPELMALAGMLFLFDESFSIYGGNVKSTMAGEFSFSIALSLRRARARPVRPRPAGRQVPQLVGHRARPGDRLPRCRGDLRRARGDPAVARLHGQDPLPVRARRARPGRRCSRRSGSCRSCSTTST